MKAVLLTFSLSILWVSIVTTNQVAPVSLKNPEIETKWQESSSTGWFYEDEDLHRGVQFQDKDIIVSSWVSSLLVTCSAYYPVQWVYDVSEDLIYEYPSYGDSIAQRSHRSSEVFEDPSSYRYFSYLRLNGDGRLITGNYSCTSVTDESLQANRYIFWAGSTRSLIYGEGVGGSVSYYSYGGPPKCTSPSCNDRPSKTVMADQKNQTIILPCSVCQPDTTIRFTKKINLTYDEVNLTNSSIAFNPKLGFILKVQELPSPYGIYKCETLNSNETLIVNATRGIRRTQTGENDILDAKAKYYFDSKTNRIVCCSSGTKAPKIYIKTCQNEYDCNRVKLQLRDFQYIDKHESSSRAMNCRSTSPWSNYARTKNTGAFRCFGDGIDVTRNFLYVPAQPRQPLGYDRPGYTIVWFYGAPSDSEIQDKGKNESVLYIGDEISNLPKEDLITISTSRGSVSEDTFHAIHSNLTVTLRCHPSTYLFSYGVRWSIVWKNHTTQLQPVATETHHLSSIGLNDDGVSKLEFLVKEDILSVVCYAPLYDSPKWMNKTLTLNITHPIPPKIDGPLEETFVWSLADTNKEFTCQAEGNPRPRSFIWTYPWSDHDLGYPWRTRPSGRNVDLIQGDGNSKIKFNVLHDEYFGKYLCTVTTEAGTAVKTFIVARPGNKEAELLTTTSATVVKSIQIISNDDGHKKSSAEIDTPSSRLIVGREADSAIETESTTTASVWLIVALGTVSVAFIICGIGLVVIGIKMRRQQKTLERLKQTSYHSLKNITESGNNTIDSDEDI